MGRRQQTTPASNITLFIWISRHREFTQTYVARPSHKNYIRYGMQRTPASDANALTRLNPPPMPRAQCDEDDDEKGTLIPEFLLETTFESYAHDTADGKKRTPIVHLCYDQLAEWEQTAKFHTDRSQRFAIHGVLRALTGK
ncbi:ORF94 [Ranid herpesvirus 2]|uniref:ORF94 n=1 Tax=Ranid herpesvirus 2 TaxID=389214 RepID=Q14W12_9VIRU|nr:ORF94 [Ranid herpesvirus 2]ABG25704.1 ORF94 [Ranid herpesvirus 2]